MNEGLILYHMIGHDISTHLFPVLFSSSFAVLCLCCESSGNLRGAGRGWGLQVQVDRPLLSFSICFVLFCFIPGAYIYSSIYVYVCIS